MKPLDQVVAVRKSSSEYTEVYSVATGRAMLRLDQVAALALADDLTRCNERPLRAAVA
jgi:hypothetical protein